jgi:hypothetical protein
MAAHYRDYEVRVTYHHKHKSDLSPTPAKLRTWDADLFRLYEDHLMRIMLEYGIRRTKGNKSRVLLLARVSNGNVSGQVRNACEYFVNVKS